MTTRRAASSRCLTVVVASFGAAAQTLPRPPVLAGCPTENLAFHTCALQKAKTFNRRARRAESRTFRATGAAC